jgi:uncharacterized membrane protein
MEISIEVALAGGILLSAALMAWGLAAPSAAALRWGLLLLMVTPVARVVIMVIGLFEQRDLLFGVLSLVILSVLASSFYTAVQISTARRGRPPVSAPRAVPASP